ncbi:tagatose-bisphosphate aldolase, partial [Acinetobacter baumannii]|nr:tagatose-bisphosphate aldolase [Acinetobacter baumannii]
YDITRYLASEAGCVLVDPICAVPGIVDEGVLSRNTGLLVGLDASGWETSPQGYRISTMVEGINARKVRELGASGGKIMI